jgi:type III restriction enzyme
MQTGGVSAKVEKRGKPVDVKAKIIIGKKTTTARGKRYVTLASFTAATADGAMRVISGTEKYSPNGGLAEVEIVEQKYIESDTALLQRVLGRDVGGKQNILILNDEAHHAYRIRKDEPDPDEEDEEGADEFFKEATVWVDGLDKVHKHRGINLCVDLCQPCVDHLGQLRVLANKDEYRGPFFSLFAPIVQRRLPQAAQH